jgi:hypothetical protein
MNSDEERAAKYRDDPRATEELIQLVLSKDADADNDEYWHPIWVLQHRLPLIFDRVTQLSKAPDEKSRDTAAALLGQNGVKNKFDPRGCLDQLLLMVPGERSAKVLGSIAFACGHLHEPGCIETLLHLKQHRDADVRYAVVHSLSGHDDNRAIQALIELSSDNDKDVRNWATFGLGSRIDTDTAEIRNALFARLQEADSEIRGEALVGLARRNDERVITPLLRELESESPDVLREWTLISEAIECVLRTVTQTRNELWLPILEKAKAVGIGEIIEIQAAIDCCKPRHA